MTPCAPGFFTDLYKEKPFHVLTREEYVDIVCDELELLRPEIVINRITGDPNPDELIEPKWLIKKFGVLNEIDKELVKRDSSFNFYYLLSKLISLLEVF